MYLLHATEDAHVENDFQLWLVFFCNFLMVITGFIFMYKLFTLKNAKKIGITFGIILLINYFLILLFGSFFDLLG
ncbi:hypothetical protein B5V89_17480 [Heyndrickxia sporothermodurans]|nr:hypothetical protein [Heyndrickxia sporothermodurans]MBL5771572.1 hypothetical protein [Heyndrickxia sporothermodurans]MBL5810509.1 hypothetical protein [Heyndrickxia sporothermodurans]MBL5865071.1 hypothetical protein [Heyndrickxia sporothermodurans]MED3654631.1 hypothetical protein [Heyndrickxia sporothermodurans]PTY76667.1 hypothetical protein B5V89_17480 [Heyndrickxia sporothermodurans]